MNDQIRKILDDLYRIDSGLKEREEELIKLVEKLLSARPAAEPDEAFLAELRQEVLTALSAMPVRKVNPLVNVFRNLSGYRLTYALGGAALALLVAVPLLNPNRPSGVRLADSLGPVADTLNLPAGDREASESAAVNGQAAGAIRIERLAAKAFGPLTGGSVMTTGDELANRGGGEGAGESSAPMAVSAPAGASWPPSARADVPTRLVFDYDGKIPASPGTVEVLKVVSPPKIGDWALSSVLGPFGMGLVDLSKLSAVRVQNLNLEEGREYGYQVSIDLNGGSVHFSPNFSRWPYGCERQGVCPEPPRIAEADLPDDGTVIAAANRFLEDMGIGLDGYGQPTVNGDWRVLRMHAEKSGDDFWFPESLTVTYPLVVNGLPVFEPGGSPYGMNVDYSVRFGKVTNVAVFAMSFQSSEYEAQADSAEIAKAVENGGNAGGRYLEPVRDIHYGLGEPTRCYLLSYGPPDPQSGLSPKLLVPALAFRIDRRPEISAGDTLYYGSHVVVPLAKDFYR